MSIIRELDLLSQADVAAQLGIAVRTQRDWRQHNRNGFRGLETRIGRRVFYKRSELLRWIEGQH